MSNYPLKVAEMPARHCPVGPTTCDGCLSLLALNVANKLNYCEFDAQHSPITFYLSWLGGGTYRRGSELRARVVSLCRANDLALTAFRNNKDLQACDQGSILASVMIASQLGLEIGVLGHAYLVPYKGQCQLIPGWRGLVDLVSRAGKATVWTGAVYEGDGFDYALGDSPAEPTPAAGMRIVGADEIDYSHFVSTEPIIDPLAGKRAVYNFFAHPLRSVGRLVAVTVSCLGLCLIGFCLLCAGFGDAAADSVEEAERCAMKRRIGFWDFVAITVLTGALMFCVAVCA